MADNYLEKQYERYLAQKAAWEKSSKNKRTKNQQRIAKDDFYWES